MPAAIDPLVREASMEPRENGYDDAVDDFMRDIPINNDNTSRNQAEPVKDIDEEIKVRKKRTPIPKLDEALLLSDKGVPKLRKVVKTRLKFKGKGHEFNDMAKLLNTYQLWLDDLYPRAKFRDALAMVEKLGHGKRMAITRKGWIDESKPNRKEDTPERQYGMDEEMVDTEGQGINGSAQDKRPNSDRPNDYDDQDMPDEDDLDALLNDTTSHTAAPSTAKQRGPFADVSDDEDDLAALMAEHETSRAPAAKPMNKKPGPFEYDDDDDQDDLDALLAENELAGASSNHVSIQDRQEVQEEEQDDLDALLAEHDSHQTHSVSPAQHTEPVHAEDNLEDEEYLDALVAEQEPLKPSEAKPGPDSAKQQQHHLDDVVDEDNDMADTV